ncbi:CLUMA_CG017937, isoform A [Clunio marinus]|uniref:CLUMA_CG017937, isoform A n=1 Tax=Clunio marinus TaxID=568069 RepID=A0A1J1J0E9_9DIPT|nr:CLUMA_CG017937, isoform A [Clunio marinus]
MRRNSVNINELINRFETDDDIIASENAKYVRVTRPKGKLHAMYDEDAYTADENRLMRYNENFKFFNLNNKRNNVTMTNAKEMTKQSIALLLNRISGFLEMVSKFPFPRMSVMSFGLTSLLAIFICPRGFTERALYPGFRLIFTTIYPAYRSFKAVRNKNLKEYLKWIIFWIVYAFFTCIELLTDAVMSWFPCYYEIKVIILIWLLGPSSRGAIKLYKMCIHPMLLSREQEIDEIIQTAQERGYMHVFRLGSKSVNYANKIIMQEGKPPGNSFISSHQLMKNVSLSNLSDVDTISFNGDVDDTLRLRRLSKDKIPIYGNQFNYSNEHLEQRRSSMDFRCDDISSGYSSPSSPQFFRHPSMRSQTFIEERGGDKETFYRDLYQNQETLSMKSDIEHFNGVQRDVSRQKAAISELSDDEIIAAYNKLKVKQNSRLDEVREMKSEESSEEMHKEFLKWIEMKQNAKVDQINSSLSKKSLENKKVNNIDETEVPKEVVNVVTSELEVNDEKIDAKDDAVDFEEFQDVISDSGDDEYLKVPLVILEDREEDEILKMDDEVKENEVKVEETHEHFMTPLMINSNIEITDKIESTENFIEAKLTLSNAPIEIVTSLSSSTFSLTSDKSIDEFDNKKQRPAKHSKGRAPLPPINAHPGQFYDEKNKKYFKETEL